MFQEQELEMERSAKRLKHSKQIVGHATVTERRARHGQNPCPSNFSFGT